MRAAPPTTPEIAPRPLARTPPTIAAVTAAWMSPIRAARRRGGASSTASVIPDLLEAPGQRDHPDDGGAEPGERPEHGEPRLRTEPLVEVVPEDQSADDGTRELEA